MTRDPTGKHSGGRSPKASCLAVTTRRPLPSSILTLYLGCKRHTNKHTTGLPAHEVKLFADEHSRGLWVPYLRTSVAHDFYQGSLVPDVVLFFHKQLHTGHQRAETANQRYSRNEKRVAGVGWCDDPKITSGCHDSDATANAAVTRIRTWVVAATTRSTNHYTITAITPTCYTDE